MRILAIDPGEKRIGVAVSDPTGTIARPLTILKHTSRTRDAAKIAQMALENEVEKIVIGQALDDEGNPSLSGRRALRLAATIRTKLNIPVEMWDESFSTVAAQSSLNTSGKRRKKRQSQLDDLAAAVILQSYLDSQ